MIPEAALAQGSDGSWSSAAAVAGLTLSGGGRRLATVKSGGQSMTLAWPSTLPASAVSGATATYANVFPGVNLVVTADTLGGTTSTTPNTAVPWDLATMIQNLVNSGARRD